MATAHQSSGTARAVAPQVTPEAMELAARLDRLRVSRFHRRLVLLSGIGWMFDAMDVLVVGAVVAAVAGAWRLDPQTAGLIISANLAGMFVGAAAAGALADRFGRRPVFQATLLLYSVLTGVSALAWNALSLLVVRFLAGIGLGGELPVASTLVSEFAPARARGSLLVILESFWAYGSVLAALIGYLLIPRFGWQAAFLVGALPALYVYVLRRALPESPRFLLAQGRREEAEAVLREVERESGGPGASQPDAGEVSARSRANVMAPAMAAGPSSTRGTTGVAGAPQSKFAALWRPPLRRRTVVLWVLWFAMVYSFYGIFTWLPGLLRAKGFSLEQAFLLNLLIALAQIPGYFSAAYLVERWGRKPTLVAYLLLCAAGAWFFGQQSLAARPDAAQVLVWGSVIAFFNLGAWGVVYSYTPELYPTRLRGTGAGWAAAFGRIGGIVGPYTVGWLLALSGGSQAVIFTVFTAVLVLGGGVVLILGEETRGQTLEQIAGGAATRAGGAEWAVAARAA